MDIRLEDHGSIILFRPLTDAGREWLETRTQEDAQWFGGALAVERRYAGAVADGATREGMEVG